MYSSEDALIRQLKFSVMSNRTKNYFLSAAVLTNTQHHICSIPDEWDAHDQTNST